MTHNPGSRVWEPISGCPSCKEPILLDFDGVCPCCGVPCKWDDLLYGSMRYTGTDYETQWFGRVKDFRQPDPTEKTEFRPFVCSHCGAPNVEDK